MRDLLPLVAAMAGLLLAPSVAAEPGASGYAHPGAAQATQTLPEAYPPGPLNRFAADLDLPEPDHYLGEVLRYIPGGLDPSIVVQFAVIRPGEPVQAMLINVQTVARGRWRVTSREFGLLDWASYLALRESVLHVVLAPPQPPGTGRLEVCADGGSGEVSFGSVASRASRGGCGEELYRLGLQMTEAAKDAIGRRPSAP